MDGALSQEEINALLNNPGESSSAGMADALSDSEKDAGLTPVAIALDGIAVIVNKENTASDDLTSEQIMKINTGDITNWGDMK